MDYPQAVPRAWLSAVACARSSEQGMAPCPACELYAASKHGIVGVATSVAASFAGALRVNVVLPGLVDTPFTWNQVRGTEMRNGTLVTKFVLQTDWQCVVDGQVVEGDCPGGGNGYGCSCEDVRRDDPRIKAMFSGVPMIDPRSIGIAILDLADPSSIEQPTGKVVVVDREADEPSTSWKCSESLDVKSALWAACPRSSETSPSSSAPSIASVLSPALVV